MEKRPLATAVKVQQAGQLLRSLGEAVEARHSSRFALEGADVVGDVAVNDAVLFPLPHDLGIEWFLPGIEVGPQFLDGAGGFRCISRRSCGQQGGEAQQDVPETVLHDVASLENGSEVLAAAHGDILPPSACWLVECGRPFLARHDSHCQEGQPNRGQFTFGCTFQQQVDHETYVGNSPRRDGNADLPSLAKGGGNVDIVASKHNLSADWAGGGLVSTVEDLNDFIRAIFSGKLFRDKSTLAEMTKSLGQFPDGSEYGLGIRKWAAQRKQRVYLGHTGFWGVGMFYCPATDVSVVFCRNQPGGPTTIWDTLDVFDNALEDLGFVR